MSDVGSSLVIRRATAADWPEIWPIVSAVIRDGDTYTIAPDTTEAECRDFWMGEGLTTYISEVDGEIVGTYTLKANQRGLGSHVANAGYMVRPGRFGRGIGAALCEHSLAVARDAGYEAMQFNCVVSTNERAVALWQRHGFAIVGTVPKAFRHPKLGYVDIFIMHRFL